jgi:hypothetical protein
MRHVVLLVLLFSLGVRAEGAPPPDEKCTRLTIVVSIQSKITSTDYGALIFDVHDRPLRDAIVLRAKDPNRFRSSNFYQRDPIDICKERQHTEPFEVATGLTQNVWVYEIAPKKQKNAK